MGLSDLSWPASFLLGVTFVYSGVAKLRQPTRFRDTLSTTELLPHRLMAPVALLLPPLEAGLGALTAAGVGVLAVAPLIVLLAVFSIGLAIYRSRGGVEIVCGCFADFDRRERTSVLLVRNVLLLAVASLALFGPGSVPARPSEWLATTACVVGSVVLWMLIAQTVETLATLRAYAVRE